eukprot:6201712-Pleurochrysis_carterae.AAC.7
MRRLTTLNSNATFEQFDMSETFTLAHLAIFCRPHPGEDSGQLISHNASLVYEMGVDRFPSCSTYLHRTFEFPQIPDCEDLRIQPNTTLLACTPTAGDALACNAISGSRPYRAGQTSCALHNSRSGLTFRALGKFVALTKPLNALAS